MTIAYPLAALVAVGVASWLQRSEPVPRVWRLLSWVVAGVFVALAYTPLVVHHEGEALIDHCGRPVVAAALYLDEEGSLLVETAGTVALLDDRDLERYADLAGQLPTLAREEVPGRFHFSPDPRPL